MHYALREFNAADAEAVNALAVAAFAQFRDEYADWPAFAARIGTMATLADAGELIVATAGGCIVGAVVYVGPRQPKPDFFDVEWPVMRMLLVDPAHRGRGIGGGLARDCIARARRDGASVIALHTSSIMAVALAMYQHMGFLFARQAPPIFGVAYGVYLKKL